MPSKRGAQILQQLKSPQHAGSSGPTPPQAMAKVYTTADFLNGTPATDASPTKDPAKEAAKHVPPNPEK